MENIVRVLKVVKNDLTTYNGFKYPESGYVECPDWKPTRECGNGLHGITKEYNGFKISTHYNTKSIKWMVLEVDKNHILSIPHHPIHKEDKVKFKCGNIIYCSDDAEKAILMVFDSIEEYIKSDPFVIRYLENVSEELKMVAASIDGNILQILKEPSKEIQLAAVSENGYAIEYVNNPSKDLQLAAVKQNKNAKHYIRNPHREVSIYLKTK
jgi:hypothetical protein